MVVEGQYFLLLGQPDILTRRSEIMKPAYAHCAWKLQIYRACCFFNKTMDQLVPKFKRSDKTMFFFTSSFSHPTSSDPASSMAIRLPGMANIKRSLRRSLSNKETLCVPKGCVAVFVGQNQMKCFVVPVSFLNHQLFQVLLNQAEEEFGFNHPMGGLRIPCDQDTFIHLTGQLI